MGLNNLYRTTDLATGFTYNVMGVRVVQLRI